MFRPQVHSGPMRFAELDAFVDGVLSGGPLEQKLQVRMVSMDHIGGLGCCRSSPRMLRLFMSSTLHLEPQFYSAIVKYKDLVYKSACFCGSLLAYTSLI